MHIGDEERFSGIILFESFNKSDNIENSSEVDIRGCPFKPLTV